MEETKCYKVHADISQINNLDTFVEKTAKVGNFMFDNDNTVVVWLNDDKGRKDLCRVLKACDITEYFCEPITYDTIGKESSYNFLSAWFMENYNAFLKREMETQNQNKLREMYENVQKAQAELDEYITGANKASTTKIYNKKEALSDG